MAEWLKALVLKTSRQQCLVGSNPTSSAAGWNGSHIGKSARLESECSFTRAVRSTRTRSAVVGPEQHGGGNLGCPVVSGCSWRVTRWSGTSLESWRLAQAGQGSSPSLSAFSHPAEEALHANNPGSQPGFPAIYGELPLGYVASTLG